VLERLHAAGLADKYVRCGRNVVVAAVGPELNAGFSRTHTARDRIFGAEFDRS